MLYETGHLHSQVHHPQDAIFGVNEQGPPVWMELQQVDRDAAQVTLINILPERQHISGYSRIFFLHLKLFNQLFFRFYVPDLKCCGSRTFSIYQR